MCQFKKKKTCAYEHELLDYISDTGEIDKVMYERVVDNIIKAKCPHVDCMRPELVKTTYITGKHLAMTVGTVDALKGNAI